MIAPDKIYINGWSAFSTEPVKDGTEYIRKEALLEWAKETYLNENASAIRKICFKQLIDKLNEM